MLRLLWVGALASGCSWPSYDFPEPTRGCTPSMPVCLTMETSPADNGWLPAQAGGASAEVHTDELTGSQTLRLIAPTAESGPSPEASFSLGLPASLTGRFVVDFRLLEVGPYTQVTFAELALGERMLRFHLRNVVEEQAVFLQLVMAGGSEPISEHEVGPPETFQTSRVLELRYDLRAPRSASLALEGRTIHEGLPLAEDWTPASPTLRIGAFGYTFPSSDATFELDNVGFE